MVILEQTHLVKKKAVDNKKSMKYSIFQQALTIAVILLISKIIESFMPIPMPASVIGLVLLFIALCTGIVKLGQVETVGTALTNNIGFLFVPAGISVINSLPCLLYTSDAADE